MFSDGECVPESPDGTNEEAAEREEERGLEPLGRSRRWWEEERDRRTLVALM
jgi:hypothetical protein